VFLESLPAYKKTKDLADVEEFFRADPQIQTNATGAQ
jgi:hypothetical protein